MNTNPTTMTTEELLKAVVALTDIQKRNKYGSPLWNAASKKLIAVYEQLDIRSRQVKAS